MDWKDTVMTDRELLKFELKYIRDDTFYWGAAFNAALERQAEISFKAGELNAIKRMSGKPIYLADLAVEWRDKGRKEVIEILRKIGWDRAAADVEIYRGIDE